MKYVFCYPCYNNFFLVQVFKMVYVALQILQLKIFAHIFDVLSQDKARTDFFSLKGYFTTLCN